MDITYYRAPIIITVCFVDVMHKCFPLNSCKIFKNQYDCHTMYLHYTYQPRTLHVQLVSL